MFYSIQRKLHEVDNKFLGKEYQQLRANWEEYEKKDELDTSSPHCPMYFDDDCEIVGQKEPTDEAYKNALEA